MNDITKDFIGVVELIRESRENAIRKVNEELILLYRNVGKYVSEQIESQKWGSSYVDELASFISENCPGVKGFNRRGLYRMKQFYEIYKDNEFVSTLLTQISWSNHLAILSSAKSDEEREFYIKLSIKERYSARELQRQLDSGYFERYMLSTEKLEPIPVVNAIKSNSRSLSPTLISEYTLKLIDKKLLKQKLHELSEMVDLNMIDSEV